MKKLDAAYEVNLASWGASGPHLIRPKTAADALKAAKQLAKDHPGEAVALYSAWYVRGSLDRCEETRRFRADDTGRVREEI